MHVMRKYNAKPQRICIFFFHVFDLVKNAKKRRDLQNQRGTCESHYPSDRILDFEVEIIFLKTLLDFFFNFIDSQPRYHT